MCTHRFTEETTADFLPELGEVVARCQRVEDLRDLKKNLSRYSAAPRPMTGTGSSMGCPSG